MTPTVAAIATVVPRPLPRTSDRTADVIGRIVVVVLFTLFAAAMLDDFGRTGRLTGLLLVVNESLVVILTLVRRSAAWLDRSWRARVLTVVSMVGPSLFRPGAGPVFLPDLATAAWSAAGVSIVIAGKLSLGRSFGLMPANRGIVCSGLYRLVRHPIYGGYLVTHLGFLTAHPTLRNLLILLTADLALLVRAIQEERTLMLDPQYVAYQQRVRWRVLPGAF